MYSLLAKWLFTFAQITQDEVHQSGWKKYTGKKKKKKKKRGPNWFSPMSFIPSFGFVSPAGLHSWLIFLITKSSLVRIRPCKTLWTATQFHWTKTSFAHFAATFKLRIQHGLQGQTRAQTQDDFEDNFNERAMIKKAIDTIKILSS